MTKKGKFILLCLIIFSFLCAGVALASWTVQTVDSTGNSGAESSLAIDASGNPVISYRVAANKTLGSDMAVDATNNLHLAYYDYADQKLYYGKYDGSVWSTYTVTAITTGAMDSVSVAIAIGTDNIPQIAYYASNGTQVIYTKKSGTTWTLETVDTVTAGTVSNVCLSLNSSNNPGVAYSNTTNVRFASKSGSTWTATDLSDTTTVNSKHALDYDQSDHPRIAYLKTETSGITDLKVASWNGSSWDTVVVDTATCESPSLKIDTQNNLHVIYVNRNSTNLKVKHARFINSAWEVSEVESLDYPARHVTFNADFALDSSGLPRIAVQDGFNLQFFQFVTSWISSSIDDYSATQRAVVINSVGVPYVLYQLWDESPVIARSNSVGWDKINVGSNIRRGIYYASQSNNKWVYQLIDGATAFMYGTSLAVDGSDISHIAYGSGLGTRSLNYATEGTANWSKETISSYSNMYSTDTVCLVNSLGLVNGQTPDISFIGTKDQLSFASKNGGAWTTQVVDTTTLTSPANSLAIDNAGNVGWTTGEKFYFIRSSTWTVQSVDTAENGGHVSLAFDSLRRPRIAYTVNNALKYATWNGTSWDTETITGATASDCSLLIDANNLPWISFHYNTTLQVARWTGTKWVLGVIDATAADVGDYCQLKINGKSKPVVSYYDATNKILKLATYTNSAPRLTWTNETNYTAGGVSPANSLNTDQYTFRVLYIDADGDKPLNSVVKLHIKKYGTEITGSPFSLSPPAGASYADGAVFTYTTALDASGGYTYYFEAADQWGDAATGEAIIAHGGPGVFTQTLNASQSQQTLNTAYGQVVLDIPAQAFTGTVYFLMQAATSFPATGVNGISFTGTDVGVEISASEVPQKALTLTMPYTAASVTGLDESKLGIISYSAVQDNWSIVPSTPDPDANKVVGTSTHFSIFRLVELIAASNLDNIKIYPNPFHPGQQAAMHFVNLTANASVKIYTLTGELVRELTAGASGAVTWNGKNDDGVAVASGVYFALCKGDGKKVEKIAIER